MAHLKLSQDLVRLLPNISEADIQKFFETLLKDDQDFVKVQLVDSIIAFEIAYANNTQVPLQFLILLDDESLRN